MGRIKTIEVTSITNELLSKYPLDGFNEKFYDNKGKLKLMPEEFPSKKILNKVAGNITSLFKEHQVEMKRLLEGAPEEYVEEEEELE